MKVGVAIISVGLCGALGPEVAATRAAAQCQLAKLVASDPVDRGQFGRSVSLNGDYAVVGAANFGSGPGSVTVLKRSGLAWLEQARLTPDSAGFRLFGHSVSINGDCVVVGAPVFDFDPFDRGFVHFFRRDHGAWVEEALFSSPDDPPKTPFFGWSVATTGELAVVGAPASGIGKAYVYGYVSGPRGRSWVELAQLSAFDGVLNGSFGQSVSITDDYVVVGAGILVSDGPGAAYVFRREGATWVEEAKLIGSAGEAEEFGNSVAVGADHIGRSGYAAGVGGEGLRD